MSCPVLEQEGGLELVLRQGNIVTTSDVYGDWGTDAELRIQQHLMEFVERQGDAEETTRRLAIWQEQTHGQ